MSPAQVLERAIEEKKKHPHMKYTMVGPNGEICMFEALARGAGMRSLRGPSDPTAMNRAREAMGFLNTYEVCVFNNRHTKEECIAKMEEGLARLQAV